MFFWFCLEFLGLVYKKSIFKFLSSLTFHPPEKLAPSLISELDKKLLCSAGRENILQKNGLFRDIKIKKRFFLEKKSLSTSGRKS
jgi:hypothetical protein